MVSFAQDLEITPGTLKDWPYFARWHYRSHRVGSVRYVTLLWHGDRPIGICVFTTAPLSLAGRNRFFGRSGRWTRLTLRSLNRQIVSLSRVVLHPTYRGAGIAAAFVRRSCESCPFPWVESLAAMGRVNPFFEKAGFVRVDVPRKRADGRSGHSAVYGTPEGLRARRRGKRLLTAETHAKSRHAEPAYFIFDNRASFTKQCTDAESADGKGSRMNADASRMDADRRMRGEASKGGSWDEYRPSQPHHPSPSAVDPFPPAGPSVPSSSHGPRS